MLQRAPDRSRRGRHVDLFGADGIGDGVHDRGGSGDRTGLAAGRSTRSFLLQTYRRDMGGGNFVVMKDVSAPISVRGRHWGGYRIGFRV